MDTPYTRLEDIAHEYAQHFDLDDYMPSDHEREVVKQAIYGLMCREDFMETIIAARALTHAARKEDGQHPCCGAGLDHPHYSICVNALSRSEKHG